MERTLAGTIVAVIVIVLLFVIGLLAVFRTELLRRLTLRYGKRANPLYPLTGSWLFTVSVKLTGIVSLLMSVLLGYFLARDLLCR